MCMFNCSLSRKLIHLVAKLKVDDHLFFARPRCTCKCYCSMAGVKLIIYRFKKTLLFKHVCMEGTTPPCRITCKIVLPLRVQPGAGFSTPPRHQGHLPCQNSCSSFNIRSIAAKTPTKCITYHCRNPTGHTIYT